MRPRTLKKGDETFAVSPQHAGCTGKVENCVTSVFSACVTTSGSCWVDHDVYMAKRWDEDPVRRARARVPDELGLITKPELAAAQLRRLAALGILINWVAGDEVYGRSSFLREVCEALGLAYVFAVPADHHITAPAGSSRTAQQAAVHASRNRLFERRSCGKGSKGPRFFDWAMAATGSPHHFLLIRRLISRPDQLAYFICYVPDLAKATLTYLITIAGRRWPVETTFKTGKSVFGWDQCQARTYAALNRHTVLAALAQLRNTCGTANLNAHPPEAAARTDLSTPAPVPSRVPAPGDTPDFTLLAEVNLADLRIPLGDSLVPHTAGQACPPGIGYIKISASEYQWLLQLAGAKAAGFLPTAAEAFHLRWSARRRRHQAIARWHHYRSRLRLAHASPKPEPTGRR